MDQQADEAGLVTQALAGDQSAFARLVERYTGTLYNQAYRMLGNSQDAEDAVQEIFLKAYTRLDSFDPSRRFVAWLLTIGSNHCIDRLRRRRNHGSRSTTWLSGCPARIAALNTEPWPVSSARWCSAPCSSYQRIIGW